MTGPLFPPDDEFEPDADEGSDDEAPEGEQRAVFVSTAIPVQVSVAPLDDDRAPDGSALGSFIGERMVARCAMPREAIDRLMEMNLFSEPVPLALLVVEEEPGLQCRLFALIPTERLEEGGEDHANEPWRASVPSFEDRPDTGDGEADEGDDDDTTVASILLGHIVRFEQDRKFADDLTAEAVDVLQKIVLGGQLIDANARAVEELLGSLEPPADDDSAKDDRNGGV